MQLIRIHYFAFFLTRTTKHSCSQFRARGGNGKSDTQTTVKAIQHLELLEH